jgi:pimeloyl-ACP methyl ester carboxylesterase
MATFVLVHGAAHGGWCWRRLVPLLEAEGHRVVAPDLPGMGADRTPLSEVTMTGWAAFIAKLSLAAGGRVVLVGHSRGGAVISEAGELAPEYFLGLIYLTAVLLPAGGKTVELPVKRHEGSVITSSDGASFRVEPATAREIFYNRASAEDAAWASTQLCAEPFAPNIVPLTVSDERWGRLPRAYIECLDDRTVPIEAQRAMQARLPCKPVVTMDSDHSPFLSAPRELAAHLSQIAAVFSNQR